MINLIAFETASIFWSVAILKFNTKTEDMFFFEYETSEEEDNIESIFSIIDNLLIKANLSIEKLQAVTFNQGPGWFTRLRVGCSIAQGISFALNIPILPVISHQAVIELVEPNLNQIVFVALDARMNEVYLAAYQTCLNTKKYPIWNTLQEPILISIYDVEQWIISKLSYWSSYSNLELEPLLAGNGWNIKGIDVKKILINWKRSADLKPNARSVAKVGKQMFLQGKFSIPDNVTPLYIRNKIALTISERKYLKEKFIISEK